MYELFTFDQQINREFSGMSVSIEQLCAYYEASTSVVKKAIKNAATYKVITHHRVGRNRYSCFPKEQRIVINLLRHQRWGELPPDLHTAAHSLVDKGLVLFHKKPHLFRLSKNGSYFKQTALHP